MHSLSSSSIARLLLNISCRSSLIFAILKIFGTCHFGDSPLHISGAILFGAAGTFWTILEFYSGTGLITAPSSIRFSFLAYFIEKKKAAAIYLKPAAALYSMQLFFRCYGNSFWRYRRGLRCAYPFIQTIDVFFDHRKFVFGTG